MGRFETLAPPKNRFSKEILEGTRFSDEALDAQSPEFPELEDYNLFAPADPSEPPMGFVPEIFDPESSGYDYKTARASGGEPDTSSHWGSLDPRTGMVLKGRQHPAWDLMEEEEKRRGSKIIKKDGRYYSVPTQPPVPITTPRDIREYPEEAIVSKVINDIGAIGKVASQYVREGEPYPGEIADRLKNMVTRVISPLAYIIPGITRKDLIAELDKEAEKFTGFGPAIVPAAGKIAEAAAEWIALMKAFGLTHKAINAAGKIPVVAKAVKAMGETKFAQQFPRIYASSQQALKAFLAGEVVGQTWGALEGVEEGDILKRMNVRGATLGTIAAGFSLVSSIDNARYVRKLRKVLVANTLTRYSAKIEALPKGKANPKAKALIVQEKLELQQIDNIVSTTEAQLIGMKSGKLARGAFEAVESPQKAAERIIKYGYKADKGYTVGQPQLKKGLGKVAKKPLMPTTRTGELAEQVREVAKVVAHPVKAARTKVPPLSVKPPTVPGKPSVRPVAPITAPEPTVTAPKAPEAKLGWEKLSSRTQKAITDLQNLNALDDYTINPATGKWRAWLTPEAGNEAGFVGPEGEPAIQLFADKVTRLEEAVENIKEFRQARPAEPAKVAKEAVAEGKTLIPAPSKALEGVPETPEALLKTYENAIERAIAVQRVRELSEEVKTKRPVELKAVGLTNAERKIVGHKLAQEMREAQKLLSKVGYKLGYREAINKARNQINQIRIAQKLTEEHRKRAADIVRRFIPKEKQYRYTKRILTATTPKRIERLAEVIDTYVDREDKRLAIRDFRNFVKGVNRTYRRGEVKLGKLREDTRQAIAEVLNKFDIVKLSEAKEKDLRSLEGYVKRISGTVANAFEAMEEEATDIMQMPNARVRELERLGKVHIGTLDADQIRYIQKSLEDLIAVSERKGQIKRAIRAEKLRDDINASTKEIASRKAVEPTEMLGTVKWLAVHGQSNLDTLSSLATGKENTATKKLLDTGLHAGYKKKAGKLREFVLYTRGRLKDIGFTVKDLSQLESLEKITIGGKTFYAHRDQIVALYAHTQAEGNLRRLLKTQGLNFTVYKRHPKYGFLKAKHSIRTGKPALSEIKKVTSKITDKERELVEKHFEINNEKQAPAINETSMKMQNFELARHKKHFHVSREIERGVEGITPEISIAIDQQGRYLPRTGGNARINIVPFTREFINALQSDATYYGMSEALQDARTLLSNKKYRQRMKAAGQGRALREMTTMLRRIQGLPADRMAVELMAAKGLGNIGKSILSLRISGGGVQICSVPAAWETIEPKYFVGNIPTTPARIERLKKLSPVLWLRWEARQFDFVMGAIHAQHAFRTLLLESTPITDKMLKQYTWGDMVAIDQIDQAAQRKITAETNLKRSTKEFDQKAIKLTELATRKSQPIWDMLGRSPLTSAPNVILRGSLMFMSARNAQYNVGIRAIDDMRKGRISKTEGAKRLAGVGTANMLISLWRWLFKILMKLGLAGLLVFVGKKPKEKLVPELKEEALKELKKIPLEVPMNIIGLGAFNSIFVNIAYRAIGRIKYGKYPRPIGETRTGNVFADIVLDLYQLGDHCVDVADYAIKGKNDKAKQSAKKAADVLAELIAYRFGWPYTGPKGDIYWPYKAVEEKEKPARKKFRFGG